jgi:hypothetical protein
MHLKEGARAVWERSRLGRGGFVYVAGIQTIVEGLSGLPSGEGKPVDIAVALVLAGWYASQTGGEMIRQEYVKYLERFYEEQ